MRRILFFFSFIIVTIGSLQAQMSKDAIKEYIKQGLLQGKTERQIGEELIAKGVSLDQLQSVKPYLTSDRNDQSSRNNYYTNAPAQEEQQQQQVTEFNDTDQRPTKSIASPVGQPEGAADPFSKSKSDIFGHDLFHSTNMTFEPNGNSATPSGYKIGPGDELIVNIWGASEASFTKKVTPEGIVMIPQVGAIPVNGLTVAQATEKIRRSVSQRYAGLGSGNTQISVTLGQIRTISVNMMGEVKVPGTYRLSSFSSLFTALYRAGGVTDAGSLRNVQLVRDGTTIDTIDIYQYLFYGTTENEINLHDGDVIIVPPYEQLVTLKGQVKRPMRYELRQGESLNDALRFAGGFVGNAYRSQLKVVRQTSREKQIYTLNETDFAQFRMADGDVVTVESNLERYENMVMVDGAVYRPGEYELGGGIATVRQLIEHAEGLTPDAFLGRAVIVRENEDLSLRTIALDLNKLLKDETEDILLKKNDMLVVSRINDLQDNGTLTIIGWVNQPGTFPFADNTTIEDMVVRAGGFKRGASTIRADVARRIYDPKSTTKSNQMAQVHNVSFSDELALSESNNFILEPYDIVIVRRSPDYSDQQKVTIEGEVLFPGEYILTSADERLSSIIKRAGGLTENAYTKGSKLVRRMTSDDQKELQQVLENLSSTINIDSSTIEQTQRNTYPVGVQLERALKRTGSDYDVVLRDGDKIIVPRYDGTVRINGEVMRPNAVSYIKGKHARYYIDQAGGFGNLAKKRQTYIVYPNGTVARARRCTRIDPGCEIIVPQKDIRTKMSISEAVALSSATASIMTVIITLVTLFKD